VTVDRFEVLPLQHRPQSVRVLGHPNAVQIEGGYRCPDCRAFAMQKSVLEEIPCRVPHAVEQILTSIPGQGTTAEHYGGAEPAFPDIGDVWWPRPEGEVWVFARMDDGTLDWYDPHAEQWRGGQLVLSAGEDGTRVQEAVYITEVPDLTAGKESLLESMERITAKTANVRISMELDARGLTRVGPVEIAREPSSQTGHLRFRARVPVVETPAVWRQRS
jgi:hypothetical protein